MRSLLSKITLSLLLAAYCCAAGSTTHINDAGTWRTLTEIPINDAGTWRAVQEVYINDSGTWRLVFSSDLITVSDLTSSSVVDNPSDATATYQLESDGDINGNVTNNTIFDIGDWITPKTNMANYEVRATALSGTVSTGTIGTYQALNVSRTWTVFEGTLASTKTAQILIEIRRISDATVMDSATITLTAQVVAP